MPIGLYGYAIGFLSSYCATPLSYILNLRALVLPLINRLVNKPDLASIALLLIILWLSMKILGIVYNAVMFWVVLIARIVFWGSLIVGGIYVWNRGPDGVIEDISTAYGIWMGEYDYWKKQYKASEDLRRQLDSRYGVNERLAGVWW
jgi:hypothetical protein